MSVRASEGVGWHDEPCGRRGVRGQATVEYVLVLLAFVSMLVALAAIWHAGRDGVLIDHAVEAASHSFASGFLGSAKDLLLY